MNISFLFLVFKLSWALEGNFCREFSGYSERTDLKEETNDCISHLETVCKKERIIECMEVCENQCDVKFTKVCKLEQIKILGVESRLIEKKKFLHNCLIKERKEILTFTVYNCENTTMTQCATLWNNNKWVEIDGNCNNFTHTECEPIIKNISISVPLITCSKYPVKYLELVNTTFFMPSFSSTCKVTPISSCKKVNRTRCAAILIEKCTNAPVTRCKPVSFFRPNQNLFHMQWCQYDPNANLNVTNGGRIINFQEEIKENKLSEVKEPRNLIHPVPEQESVILVIKEVDTFNSFYKKSFNIYPIVFYLSSLILNG